MNVKEYREKHHRCRTCIYSKKYYVRGENGWRCEAKNTSYYGSLDGTMIAGIFCPLYEPLKEGERKEYD